MLKHTDITKADWKTLVAEIKRPDNTFDLNDLVLAVMAKFDVDETTAKRLVRRWDQRMTLKPQDAARLWASIRDPEVRS